MKIVKEVSNPFWENEMSFVPEVGDVGKPFIVKAGIIRYSAGGGCLTRLVLEGEGVRTAYRTVEEKEPCRACGGTGMWKGTRFIRTWWGKLREVTETRPCSVCDHGVYTRYRQVSVEEGT